MKPPSQSPEAKKRYKEQPTSMGQPLVDIDKVLGLASELEDEEITRKLLLPKR